MQTDQLFTNNSGVPLSVAVWLATDDYDYIDEPNYISVTELIKSPRQIILGRRMGAIDPDTAELIDIATRMSNSVGSAVHNSIEHAWVNKYKESMAKLGYPQKVIDRVRVNPKKEDMFDGIIPVYLEQRAYATVGKYTIGGKYDFVGQGVLDDFKTTSVFYYTSGTNEWKYYLQGSLYRWLNPDLITSDYMNIQFIFTDWSKGQSFGKGYPPTKIHQHKVMLKSVAESEVWVQKKIHLLESLEDLPEPDLPPCEPHDLWQDAPTFKYYKNPAKRSRSTKNFDTYAEAAVRHIQDGEVGVIVEVPGTARACMYCSGAGLCSQKDQLIANGTLKL